MSASMAFPMTFLSVNRHRTGHTGGEPLPALPIRIALAAVQVIVRGLGQWQPSRSWDALGAAHRRVGEQGLPLIT
jgi:hypothetical protein